MAPATIAGEKLSLDLPTGDIIAIGNAIAQLDGHHQVIKEGLQEKEILVPYTFSAGVRLAMAFNFSTAKVVFDNYQIAAHGVQKQDGGNVEKTNEDLSEILAKKQHVDFVSMSSKDLNLDANPIGITVLSALSPIIKE